MNYSYKYNKEYGTLQQWDEHGVLRSSMNMPKSDLNKLAQLNIKCTNLSDTSSKENILRKVDMKDEFDV